MSDFSKKTVKNKQIKFPSELRFDLVSRNWVVIATGRGKRPEAFKKEKRAKIKISKKDCPFCNIESQIKPVLIYLNGKKTPLEERILKDWTTMVIPNKYPALLPYPKLEKKVAEAKPHLPKRSEGREVNEVQRTPSRLALLGSVIEGGLYQTMNAVGFCELVMMRDHEKHFPNFEISQVKEVFDVYQERYLDLMKKPFVNYVSIFHNHGAEAGASQPHPHSQIITTPLIDVDLKKALLNSEKYFNQKRKCIYCEMNKWEMKVKKRVVFENKDFLAICPFASKAAFQTIVSPKKHLSNFEEITEDEKWQLAEAFQIVMKKISKALNDPPYNFYLHTAPSDGRHPPTTQKYPYYHWHWTILPKTSIHAGFEIGTRMEISTIEPEKAAEYLRKQ